MKGYAKTNKQIKSEHLFGHDDFINTIYLPVNNVLTTNSKSLGKSGSFKQKGSSRRKASTTMS